MAQINNRKHWYSMSAKDTGPVEIFIYDEIGMFGISAADFVKDLRAHKGKDISLRLNTPGGDVFGGNIIYNALRDHKGEVTTIIDGVAASIGSVIAMAGKTLRMAENAFLMIHNPFAILAGDAEELRKKADVLDKIKGTMANAYAEKSGKDLETINAWMAAETWFTAQEAQDAGFCDEIGDEMKIAASFDLSIYAHAPAHLLAGREEGLPETEREYEKSLRDAGISRKAAAEAVAAARNVYQRDADTANVPEELMKVLSCFSDLAIHTRMEVLRNGL